MAIKFIHNQKGKATGVYIPIAEWREMTLKYEGLKESEIEAPLKSWQQELLEERLNNYYLNTELTEDFDSVINDIEPNL
ncbi:hypothetical protein [Pelobium manganitolerans]|uniref:hypothetical protein n=1 Tax=Pelobium manganitolerans TaxID=1842495 RepID=UPI003FA3C721